MKEQAKRQIAVWYSAPVEALERDLNTLKLFEPLTQDERDELIAIGEAMLAAKRTITPPKSKRGRPIGAKTAVKIGRIEIKEKEVGNGE